MQPKLSFIVPVYNVEKYLWKCVGSLLAQDYDDYEIILVDDGSTDNSGAICDELASNSSIRVIHQVNAGLSAARNSGIKAANGEYLCFVDSDDYWEENVLGSLMAQILRDNLDVLRFDYQNVNERYEVFEPNKTPRYVDKRKDIVDGETYLNSRMSHACYAVMFIMRREIVPTFTEGIHFEDTEWLPRMLFAAKRVNATTRIVYNYFWRVGSITQVHGYVDKIRKNVEDKLTIIAQYNRYLEQYPSCIWLKKMRSVMVVSVIASVGNYLYFDRKEYITRLRLLGVFPITMANLGKTYLRKACLINISPNLAIMLIHLKNHRHENNYRSA